MYVRRIFKTALLVGATALGLLAGGKPVAAQTTITFSESESSGVGFNGQVNPFFLSTDGQYRVEAFWLNTGGHFHDNTNGINTVEGNHNNSGGLLNALQGVRITRVDSALFTVLSMDLFGQASISPTMNPTTGVGTWSLFSNNTGSFYAPGTVSFGTQYAGVNALYLADPGAAGGNSSTNAWDNIRLTNASAVPEPTSALLFLPGLAAFGLMRLRKKKQAAPPEPERTS